MKSLTGVGVAARAGPAASDSAGRLPVSAEGLAASSPARPPTPAAVPAAVLGAVLQSPVASGTTKLDCMVRVPRNICQN